MATEYDKLHPCLNSHVKLGQAPRSLISISANVALNSVFLISQSKLLNQAFLTHIKAKRDPTLSNIHGAFSQAGIPAICGSLYVHQLSKKSA